MAHGLAVAADGLYGSGCDPCLLQQDLRGLGVSVCQAVGDELRLVQFVMRDLVQGEQCFFQRLCIRLVMAGNEAG